jgi:hypothetical protein
VGKLQTRRPLGKPRRRLDYIIIDLNKYNWGPPIVFIVFID